MCYLRFVSGLYPRYHRAIELVPHNKVSFFEKYKRVGECVEEHVEALGKLLTPRLGEVHEGYWLLLSCQILLFLFHLCRFHIL